MTTQEKKQMAPKAQLVVGGQVAPIVPTDVDQVHRLAQFIAGARWAPISYLADPRNRQSDYDVNKITVGIMHGLELGFTPLAALQSIAIINGMPSVWGDGAKALVMSSGLVEDFKEWIEGSGTDMVAHCEIQRKDQKTPTHQTFSMDEARDAGLLNKQGPWKDYTRRMLQMRARSWAMRDACPEVLRGVKVAEEAMDMVPLQQYSDGSYGPAAEAGQAAQRPTMSETAAETAAEDTNETQAEDAEIVDESAVETEPAPEPEWYFIDVDGIEDTCQDVADFGDRLEKQIKTLTDISAMEGLWDSNKPYVNRMLKSGWDGAHDTLDRCRAHKQKWEKEAKRQKEAATAQRKSDPKPDPKPKELDLELFNETGQVVGAHKTMEAWYRALTALVADSDDPATLLQNNLAIHQECQQHDQKKADKLYAKVTAASVRDGEDQGGLSL